MGNEKTEYMKLANECLFKSWQEMTHAYFLLCAIHYPISEINEIHKSLFDFIEKIGREIYEDGK